MRQPSRIWRWVLVAFAVTVAVPVLADPPVYGRQVRYAGIHPIPKSEGGGMCYIEGPHVHIYAADPVEYREHGDDHDHVFVGDPVAYGYDGPKYAYNGPHPIEVDAVVGGPEDVEYCYIDGPHFHPYAPAVMADFKLVGDAYFYVGEPPRAFIDARPRYIGINERYHGFTYVRPVVAVEPPHGWIGVRAEFAAPGVVVGGPGVVVGAPGVEVGVRGPGVVVERPGVVVGVHAPGVVVAPRAGVDVRVHENIHENVHAGGHVDVHAGGKGHH